MNIGHLSHSPDVDLLFALSSLGNVIGCLHAHQRVHPDAKCVSMRSAISPERSALPLSRLESAGRETLSAAAAVTDRPAGSMISVRIKSPGWGGFFIVVAKGFADY